MNIFKPAVVELTPEALDELLQEIRKEKAKVTAKYADSMTNQNYGDKDEDYTCDCAFCVACREFETTDQLPKEDDSEKIEDKEAFSQLLSEHNLEDEPEDVLGLGKFKDLYPKYHKDVSDLDTIDIYKIHELFEINDPSGRIHHASKKLLLAGSRNGGKDKFQDIREARDTLDSWLVDNS